MIDKEVTIKHVQSLNSRDAVASFFAHLGYRVDQRTEQRPENLGVTADSLKSAITHIENVATQEEWLRVLLVELKSVTVAHTRTLVNSLRNLSGDYLLVLTSDYEEIDFVLLERIAPKTETTKGLSTKQVKARPRVITVERRNPARIALRVLRRFAYTEADPIAQYEKLVSAFDTAEWSEEHFDNRALFADYFLTERLPDRDEWQEDAKPVFQKLAPLYARALSTWADKHESELRKELLVPTLQALGWNPKEVKGLEDSSSRPDYELCADGANKKAHPLCLCLTYPWDRQLDGKDYTRDPDTPDENPGALVVTLLRESDVPYAIVTNGKYWRLYSSKTHSMATRFYQVDLPEIIARADPAEAFRYFWLVFRAQGFEPRTEIVEGEERETCFVGSLIDGSREYAKRLGERLKDRVFEDIFPHFAEGFIRYQCARGGRSPQEFQEEELDQVFQGTLTFLYRLLFLLYAESRDLLPVRETRGYWDASLSKLKGEIAEKAGDILDETPKKLKSSYSHKEAGLYDRVFKLFRIVDKGDSSINMPTYNGGLFLTDPDPDDESAEAQTARFLLKNKVPDRSLALGLDLMARDLDDKTHALAPIDYKSLGVRQLGSIYEGLLEFKVRVAQEPLAVVKEKGSYKYKPYGELTKAQREKLGKARASTVQRGVERGDVYLENDRRERKATGSYYTPDYIVKYIVEHTVGPVLDEKFDAMRPKLRKAQQTLKAFRSQARAKKDYSQDDARRDALKKHRGTLDELFDVKVLDPAMGSGHFLVEAVDFITDRMIDFLNAFPWNPVTELLEETRRTILGEMEEAGINIDPGKLTDVNLMKRHVLKRCVYGVDLNPMAVELAKVSLWLDCFTLGAPLSFLDHHLRCGNSLIGTDVQTVRKGVEGKKAGAVKQMSIFSSIFTGLEKVTEAMVYVGKLTDTTVNQVRDSVRHYQAAQKLLKPYKGLLDVWVSEWFDHRGIQDLFRDYPQEVDAAVKAAVQDHGKPRTVPDGVWERVQVALRERETRKFFHWELEFPEVWYGTAGKRKNPGFHCTIGNPPYQNVKRGLDPDMKRFFWRAYACADEQWDVGELFYERALSPLLNAAGGVGLIVPKPFFLSESYRRLRNMLLAYRLSRYAPCGACFDDPAVEATVCVVFLSRPRERRVQIDCGRSGHFKSWRISDKGVFQRLPFSIFSYLAIPEFVEPILAARDHGELCALQEVVQWTRGVEAGKSDSCVTREPHEPASLPLIVGEDLREFQVKPSRWIMPAPDETTFKNPRLYSQSPKVLLRRVAQVPIAAVDTSKAYVLNTVYVAHPTDSLDHYALVGLLNSLVFRSLYMQMFNNDDALFPYVRLSQIAEVPVPPGAVSDTELSILSRSLSEGNTTLRDAETRNALDERVVELYALPLEMLKKAREALHCV